MRRPSALVFAIKLDLSKLRIESDPSCTEVVSRASPDTSVRLPSAKNTSRAGRRGMNPQLGQGLPPMRMALHCVHSINEISDRSIRFACSGETAT
jgi:hypothetical protein